MPHYSLAELYSISKVLADLEPGDSLTDIQLKTGLSFSTVQKVMKGLKSIGVVSTIVLKNERGKKRECTRVSLEHKKAASFFLEIVDKIDSVFSNSEKTQPLLFDIEMHERMLGEIKKVIREKISPQEADKFEKWIKNSEGNLVISHRNFSIKIDIHSIAKI